MTYHHSGSFEILRWIISIAVPAIFRPCGCSYRSMADKQATAGAAQIGIC